MADEAADGRAPAVQGRAPESDAPADTASPMAPDSSAADELASLAQRTEERFRRTEESFRRLENMTEGLTRTVGSFMAVISASPVANRLSGEQEAAELAALPTVPILRQRVDGDGPGADSARRDLQRDLESAARGPRPRQHDARPDSVNRGESQARSVFPFLPDPPAEADMPREAAETSLLPRPTGVEVSVEGADSGPSQSGMLPGGWRLLTRASMQGSVDALPGASAAPSTILRAMATGVKCGRGTISAQAPRVGILPGQEWRPRWDTVLSPSSLPRAVCRGVSRQACARPTRAPRCRSQTRSSNCSRASSRSSKTRQGGGCVISGNSIDWLSLAAERLRERRISPAKWVAAVMPRLADSVRQRFRAHFDGEEGALLSTALPFTTPSQALSTAEAVTWEDFWPWLLAEYLRPAHLDAARRAWAASPPSSLARLEFDTNAFNTLLLRADMMEAIMQNDVPNIRAPRMVDTYERRETYRRLLPPSVLNYVVQFESTRAHAWGAGSSVSSSFLGPSRHQQASDELALVELQDAALIGARVQLREITRQEQRRGAGSGSSLPADARLTSLEAGAEGMGLYDTGASVSFIEAAFAKRHGLTVHSASHHLRVLNGDGSFQSAQGEVRVFLNIGASFSEKITFVVINLDQFDFIIGLPDINGFRMELRGDPMRIHILGTKKKIVAPTVIGSWEDESGQRHVQVLDFSAAEIKGWQAAGHTEAYHLFEDPHAEMRAAGAWDPGE